MKKFFTILAIFGLCATPMLKAQDFPGDPGTLVLDLALAAETDSGDTLQMDFTGAGSYAKGTEVTIIAPTRLGYTFLRWSDENEENPRTFNLNESMSLTAIYSHDQFQITFLDATGEVLQDGQSYYGDQLMVPNEPYHEGDAQYSYNFAGWSPALEMTVIGEQTYFATYDTITNRYSIKYLDWDDTLLADDTLAYGTMPQYKGENPTREATDQFTYTFKGWNPEISLVTGEQTYQAEYEITTNEYAIIFLNWNGDTLSQSVVEYGAMIDYPGETPVKEADAQHTFTFKGWNPELAEVTGSQTYIAQFDSTVNQYDVTFYDWDGQTILYQTTLDYGTLPQYPNENPTREATEQFTYIFTGWDNEIVPVTGQQTYTAQFETITNSYSIKFFDWDNTLLEDDTIPYGTMPQFGGETPTRNVTQGVIYTFERWDPTLATVTGEASYTALYRSDTVRYQVVVILEQKNHTTYDTIQAVYGQVVHIQAPDTDDQHFTSWSDGNTDSERDITITDDITLRASYSDSYMSIAMQPNQWNFICIPAIGEAGGEISSEMFSYVGFNNPVWGRYDGELRASANSGWVSVNASEESFASGEGYIIYPTADGELRINIYSEEITQQTITRELNKYDAVHEQNANWNFVGNPFYQAINASQISIADATDASITVWNGTGYSSELIGISGTVNISPLQAFFIQANNGLNNLTITTQQNPGGAPARAQALNENSRIDIHATAGGYTDKTRVIFRSNSSVKYEAGRDAAKFMTATAPIQMYFLDVDNVQCAQMVRPAGDDNMRLGFTLLNAGDITINMPVFAGDYELYDAFTGRSYDLNEEFTIYSEAGTFDERLELRPIKYIATAIDNNQSEAFTVLSNGIYVSGNAPVAVYTILGQHLCTQNVQGLLTLQNGTFVIVSGDKAAKVTVQ